jgi:uncharacterized protein (TIGR02246 family)
MQFARLVAGVCLFGGSALVVGCSQPKASGSESEIRQFLADWDHAFQSKNVEAMSALYAPDVIAYDIIPPLQYIGKEAYMKDFQQFFASLQGQPIVEERDVHIVVSGNLADVFYLQHIGGSTVKGDKVGGWVRATAILRKQDGKWLDIHDHVSFPTNLDTGLSLMDLKP